jgi:hypothetical protein
MNLSHQQLEFLRGAIQSIDAGDVGSAKIKIRKAIELGDPLLQTVWTGKPGRCTWQPCVDDCVPGFDVCEFHLAQSDALGAFEDPTPEPLANCGTCASFRQSGMGCLPAVGLCTARQIRTTETGPECEHYSPKP